MRRLQPMLLALTALALATACADNGDDGLDGSSCTVTDTAGGAMISCADGTSVEIFDGADGSDGAAGAPGAPGAPGTAGVDGADGVGCASSLLADGYEITCSNGAIYVDTTLGTTTTLSSVDVSTASVVLVASKKNGGTGGSRWFDADVDLGAPETLTLPSSIPAVGNPGNGQKLYVLFTRDGAVDVDCAWFSGSGEYGSFRCFEGATRNGGTSAGFTGGTEVFITEVVDATSLDMNVAGASGSGDITTATATFTIVP